MSERAPTRLKGRESSYNNVFWSVIVPGEHPYLPTQKHGDKQSFAFKKTVKFSYVTCCLESKVNICITKGRFLVQSLHTGFLPRLPMKRLKGLHSCYSQGHDDNAWFFLHSISLNGTLAKIYLRGKEHKSKILVFPDHWATSRFNYFFFFFFSTYFQPVLLFFHPSYLLSLSPPEKIRSVGGFCLFFYIFDNGRWCIYCRSGSAHPVQEVRQDGHDRARHVEAHRPTHLGSGLCM